MWFLEKGGSGMKKYLITVIGCDDETEITQELTQEQFELLKVVADKITSKSSYGCMPIMEIKEFGNGEVE